MSYFPNSSRPEGTEGGVAEAFFGLKNRLHATVTEWRIPARFRSLQLSFQTRIEGIAIMLRWKIGRLLVKKYCGAAKSQLRHEKPFVRKSATSGENLMSAQRHFVPAKPVLPIRMIAASFALGVGVMAVVGLVAPTIAMGGLSMRSAAAETMAQHQQLIAPLDVRAINAQLAQAQSEMDAARRTTDPMVSRLERLAHD